MTPEQRDELHRLHVEVRDAAISAADSHRWDLMWDADETFTEALYTDGGAA